MTIKIEKSNIVSAFGNRTIGTKVIDEDGFMSFLQECIKKHDSSKDKLGQHVIPMPSEAFKTISAGVGIRTQDPNDYILRFYRGKVSAYLKREKAAMVESLAAIVYTTEAYLSDPDVGEREARRIKFSNATHVLVAILASAGPDSPLSPSRLVHNLAGGNKEAQQWSTDEIREKAFESREYHDEWVVVADPPELVFIDVSVKKRCDAPFHIRQHTGGHRCPECGEKS